MNYIELECIIVPFDSQISEILTAELSEIGFESFVENEKSLLAYIKTDLFDENKLKEISILLNPEYKIQLNQKIIQEENWNETWEKNYFEPIVIANQCVIRSTFHPEFPEIKYQVTIDPKMSFGTGHHETTSLIVKEILEIDIKNKKIADLGCGTGILAILSEMRGAQDITAVDIDEWSYNNAIENVSLNNCNHIKVLLGNVKSVENEKFDVIYANINKNVLMDEMHFYSKCLNKNAALLLSGFYQSDFEDINEKCKQNGLKLIKQEINNNWMMLKYLKPDD
jgi:ribosomal protein L11 methyltransferase